MRQDQSEIHLNLLCTGKCMGCTSQYMDELRHFEVPVCKITFEGFVSNFRKKMLSSRTKPKPSKT